MPARHRGWHAASSACPAISLGFRLVHMFALCPPQGRSVDEFRPSPSLLHGARAFGIHGFSSCRPGPVLKTALVFETFTQRDSAHRERWGTLSRLGSPFLIGLNSGSFQNSDRKIRQRVLSSNLGRVKNECASRISDGATARRN